MAEMRDFASEAWDHITHRHHHETSAAQATAATPTAAPTEEHMSILDALHELESKVVTVGEDVIEDVAVLRSSPEGAALFGTAVKLVKWAAAGIISPAALTSLLSAAQGFEGLAQGYVTAHEQAAASQQAEAQPA